MTDHLLFHIVFLCQVLLVSFVLPRRIFARMAATMADYPPSSYPKLYPGSIEGYERDSRLAWRANLVVLVAGLVLLAVLVTYPRSGGWDATIAIAWFLVQLVPVMLIDRSSLRYARLLRERSAVRRAGLQPRRLTDLVSPVQIGMAVCAWLAFALLVVYLRQFDYPWFGGYANIVGVTLGDLFLLMVVALQLHGRKPNPLQSSADRLRVLETMARSFIIVSIASKIFIALNIALAALALREWQPVVQSVFAQGLAVVTFRGYVLQPSNVEVYRESTAVR